MWKDGKYWGKGIYFWKDGQKLEGTFENGLGFGYAVYTYKVTLDKYFFIFVYLEESMHMFIM